MTEITVEQILCKHLQNGTIDMLKINVEDLSAEIVAAMRPVNQEMLEALKTALAIMENDKHISIAYRDTIARLQAILSAESGKGE
jgi:hypothetical protein